MNLKLMDGLFSVCRLNPTDKVPDWVFQSDFYSINKTEDELSIVCEASLVPEIVKTEKYWSLIKVEGPLDFSLTGILSSLAKPLADEKISIFAISTFDTDYLLVKKENLSKAKSTLENSGFSFID